MTLSNLEQASPPQGLIGFSSQSGIIATAGGGQTNAFQLSFYVNEISTVATAADSVMLPPATNGSLVWVINHGANSVQVFGQPVGPTGVSDTIAANNSSTQAAGGTGVAQAATKAALYVCFQPGLWKQFLSA